MKKITQFVLLCALSFPVVAFARTQSASTFAGIPFDLPSRISTVKLSDVIARRLNATEVTITNLEPRKISSLGDEINYYGLKISPYAPIYWARSYSLKFTFEKNGTRYAATGKVNDYTWFNSDIQVIVNRYTDAAGQPLVAAQLDDLFGDIKEGEWPYTPEIYRDGWGGRRLHVWPGFIQMRSVARP